jgi:PTS system N-acetylglucosamine-specific IIC component
MNEYFRKIGKSFMLPVAALPLAGVLLRFGVLWDIKFMIAAGNVVFSNLPILFALSIASGLSKDHHSAAAVSAAFGYYIYDGVGKSIMEGFDTKVLGGIIIGIVVSELYNRSTDVRLPNFLSFFGGKRLVPILSILAAICLGGILGSIWSAVQRVIDGIAVWITQGGAFADFVYGFLNRALIPFGLHHVINTHVWFNFGEFNGVLGDLNRFFAGDPNAGRFMTGFFPVMMFGLPAAGLAMIKTAKPHNRKLVAGGILSAALTAFITGITEPIEFLFMFLSPLLYVVHSILTGVSVLLVNMLGIHNGFTFSAGIVDYLSNMNNGVGEKSFLLLVVGLVIGAVYYFTFIVLIKKFNLKTPGREDNLEYVNALNATITAVTKYADDIAVGDLTFEMEESLIKESGDIGHLAKAFNTMKNNLMDIVNRMQNVGVEIKETSENLDLLTQQSLESANSISSAVEEVAKGAASQARDTEDGSKESARLGGLIEENIERIEVLNDKSSSITDVIKEGTVHINELNENTGETRKAVSDIQSRIEETSNSVETIKEVSNFIASISEQTNLLALNASIEAARAGEAGRGFAVVADEIRKLAEASKSSTEEIDEAVKKLSMDAENSVQITKELVEVIQKQLESVKITSTQFNSINEAVNDIIMLIERMSHSSQDMHEAKERIMEVMTNLSAIAEENAASTEETSVSASEQTQFIGNISTQSKELLEMVSEVNAIAGHFKIQ